MLINILYIIHITYILYYIIHITYYYILHTIPYYTKYILHTLCITQYILTNVNKHTIPFV